MAQDMANIEDMVRDLWNCNPDEEAEVIITEKPLKTMVLPRLFVQLANWASYHPPTAIEVLKKMLRADHPNATIYHQWYATLAMAFTLSEEALRRLTYAYQYSAELKRELQCKDGKLILSIEFNLDFPNLPGPLKKELPISYSKKVAGNNATDLSSLLLNRKPSHDEERVLRMIRALQLGNPTESRVYLKKDYKMALKYLKGLVVEKSPWSKYWSRRRRVS